MLKVFCTYILLSIGLSLFPQDPAATYYTTKDGLLSNNIFHVMQDSKGFIWLCTDKGVSRFDGEKFENFGKNEGLDGYDVFISFEDDKGKIWFGSYSSNIYYFEAGKMNRYIFNDTISKYLPEKSVKTSIFYNSNDELILGTLRNGYLKIDKNGNNITKFWSTGKNVIIDGINTINYSVRSKVPPYTISVGVNVIDENSIISFYGNVKIENIRKKPNFYSIYNYKDSSYIISSHNYLYYYKNRAITLIKYFDKPIDCLYINDLGNLLIGFIGGGIFKFSSDYRNILYKKYFDNYSVTNICQDRLGYYYISTLGNGMIKVNNFDIFKYSVGNNYISDMKEFNYNKFFVSFYNGSIYELENKKFSKRLQIQQTRTDIPVYFSIVDDQIVLSDQFENSIHSNNLDFVPFETINVVPKTYMTSVNKDVFVAASTRLFQYNKEGLIEFHNNLVSIYPELKITCLEEDVNGIIWICTNKGLFKLYQTKIVKDEEFNGEIINIISHGEGMYIYTLGKGIEYISNNDTSIIYYDDKNLIRTFKRFENTSKLFVAENDRIIIFEPNQKLKISLDNSIGIPFEEVIGAKMLNNDLWIVDKYSIYLYENFNFQGIKTLIHPPTLGSIIINDEPSSTLPDDGSLFEFNDNEIEFEVDIIKEKRSDKGQYKYRLLPGQKKWKYTNSKKIIFNSLDPDSYTLELVNISENGKLSSRISYYHFAIKPRPWRIGLNLGMIFIGSFLIYGIYFYFKKYNSQIKPNNLVYEKEIKSLKLQALFSQMNPHFTFNVLNSLQGLVLKNEKSESVYFLNKYARLVRDILSNSSNPMVGFKEELNLLDRYLEMENLRFKGEINIDYDVDNLVYTENIAIPSMILQPIVENSIKHGFKNSLNKKHVIKLRIYLNNNLVYIIIVDNGIGYSVSLKESNSGDPSSIGLNIVKERLEILNQAVKNKTYFDIGDVIVKNKIKGTFVNLTFPITKV